MNKKLIIFLIMLVALENSFASRLDQANMYYEYGLSDKAKEEYISQMYSNTLSDKEMAEAYYQLGLISFNEDNTKLAVSTWEKLISLYPNSSYSSTVKKQL